MKIAVCFLALGLSIQLMAADGQESTPDSQQVSTPATMGEAAKVSGNEAHETVCKNGAMVRRVKLGFSDASGNSCVVTYAKETEEPGAAEKVLWNAKQEVNFCKDKADGFVDKLKGMGWSCE